MAYRIYHVEGIILQSKPTGEGDALLFVYTRELGLVMVIAKSLRLGKSKLRFVLQRFAHAHLDLVRGKHGWRLTSARTISTQSALFRHPHRRRVIAATSALLMRLIQGEESQQELYDELVRGFSILSTLEEQADCYHFELLAVIRLLRALGYWDEQASDADLWRDEQPIERSLVLVAERKSSLIPRINSALRESHL